MTTKDETRQIGELKKQLRDLTKFMNVPCFRYDSIKWLDKNMERMNVNHPKYRPAREILDKLIALGAA